MEAKGIKWKNPLKTTIADPNNGSTDGEMLLCPQITLLANNCSFMNSLAFMVVVASME
jgi:hypothetical protein